MYMILSPHGKKLFRIIAIGKKYLPEVEAQERNWAFVEKIYHDPAAIKEEFKRNIYETRTRGERVLPSARPVGEGVYAIATHGNHTHFVYQVELPEKPGEVQRKFKIAPEASYIITVKNPADEDISSELGLDLHPQEETERTAEIFNELKLAKQEHKLEPLFRGEWK